MIGDVVDSIHVDDDSNDPLVEACASAFAANLLMPDAPVRAVLGTQPGAAELVEAIVAFGVSWAALRYRCDDLDIEIPKTLRDLSGPELFASAGRGAEEPHVAAPIPSRIPARLDRRIRDAYSQAMIGAGVVAMAFGVQGEALESLLAGMPLHFEMPPPVTSTSR